VLNRVRNLLLFFVMILSVLLPFSSAKAATVQTGSVAGVNYNNMPNNGTKTLIATWTADTGMLFTSGNSLGTYVDNYGNTRTTTEGLEYKTGMSYTQVNGSIEVWLQDENGNILYHNLNNYYYTGVGASFPLYSFSFSNASAKTLYLYVASNNLNIGNYTPTSYTMYNTPWGTSGYSSVNTGGLSYTEVDQISVNTLTSAQGAQTAAQSAQTAAQAAQSGTNTIVNSYLSTSAGIIQDSSGNTVLSVAKQASQNALNANTNASAAATNSQNAYNQAVTATNSANTAATNAANANTTLGTSAGVVQDSSGTVLQSARQAVTGITNIQTQISNIQNYIAPTLTKVSGYNAATVTSGTTFNVSLDYSGANEYQVKVDNGSWSGWTSLASHDTNGYFTVSGISTTGMHTIYVQIRYNGGSSVSPVAKGKMTIFKL
jgi:hypothetical protein